MAAPKRAGTLFLRAVTTVAIPCLLAGPAGAREVRFPQVHPKVAMDVPDDWAIAYTAFGLELKSPENNLYIVADILPRKKDEADAWAKKATEKMEAFGVTFGALKPPGMAKADLPAPPVPPQAASGVGPTAAAPPQVEPLKVELGKPLQANAEPVKPEPAKADMTAAVPATVASQAVPVDAGPSAPVPAPVPSAVDGTKPVQAIAEPLRAEASKVDSAKVEVAKPETKAAMPATIAPQAASVGEAPAAASLPAPVPPTVDGAKPVQATAEPPKVEPSKVEAIAAVPPPPVVVDRAAPSFTFMNPPVAINPPAAPTPDAVDRVPVFSGPPSLESPGRSKAETAMKSDVPDGGTLEELTRATPKLPKLPFKVGRFPPATWNGQPVDVQIVNFGLSAKQLFLVVQASLSSDDRAVAIISSAHPVK